MQKLHLLLLSFMILAFSSCKKEENNFPDDITVHTKNYGTLKIKLVDNASNPLSDVRVQIYSQTQFGGNQVILDDFTDANGIFDAGKLLEGNYMLMIQNVEIDGKRYAVNMSFQVISEEDKTLNINVESYVGGVDLTVMTTTPPPDNTQVPVSQINAIIFDQADYFNGMTLQDAKDVGIGTKITDDKGKVMFEDLPAGRNYRIMVYFDENHWTLSTSSFYVEKGVTNMYSAYVDYNSIF